jgi:hypothetical protein
MTHERAPYSILLKERCPVTRPSRPARTPAHMKTPSFIEPLETRIAPAAVLTFTDVDGDIVTITSSKGTLADLNPRG